MDADQITYGKEILIVDDNPNNLRLLCHLLVENGYVVRAINSGVKALDTVREKNPDLILLDVKMPGMDGFEVCRELKKDTFTKDIPVLFISAMDDIENKTRGFQLGAVDYLPKPFQEQEVLARVKAHLTLRINQEQLVQSAKHASLATLVTGIAHELNTPIGNCVTSTGIVEGNLNRLEHEFSGVTTHSDKVIPLIAETQEAVRILSSNITKAGSLVNTFKSIAFDQIGDMKQEVLISEYIETIILTLKPQMPGIEIEFSVDGDKELKIITYPTVFWQLLSHLILNVYFHAFPEKRNAKITLRYALKNKLLMLSVEDNGCGIDENRMAKVFDPFYTTKRGDGRMGLGLHIVFNLLSNLSGKIECHSEKDKGTSFKLQFPVSLPD